MKKIYNTPVARVIAVSTEENILTAASAGPASINNSYTDAEALSNSRFDKWDDDDFE